MRKVYLLPNIVTTANLFCGFYSVVASIHHNFVAAAWAVVAASFFDMLDGRIARLARATSNFGIEYDSLSDLISFGIAPAILMYQWALNPFGRYGWLIAFFFLMCGALRLARFNVLSDILPSGYFQGVPIPTAAGAIVTFVIFNNETMWLADTNLSYFSAGLVFCLGCLMISTIRFSSFKEINWRSKSTFGYFLLGILSVVLIALRPQVTLFLLLVLYIVLSVFLDLIRVMRSKSFLAVFGLGRKTR